MTLKRRLSASVALLLCVIMLLGAIPVIPASAAPADKVEIAADRFHYGVAGAENNIELDAKTLYEMIFGEELEALSDTERAYLDAYSFTLTYNNAIPSDVIRTHYSREQGILDVTVSAYSYIAENRSLVSWTPNVVTIDRKQETLEWNEEKDAYTCQFTGMEYMSQDFDMNVSFSWSVGIDERAIRALLLNSRVYGVEAERILEEYEMACEAYRAKVALREKWDKYYADYQAYQNYLAQKDLYDSWIAYEAEKAKFDAYVKAKAENDAAWVAYNQYALLKAEYDKKKGEYTAYENKVNSMRAHVAILDMMFIEDSRKWSLYGGVCGTTVDLVISKLDTAEQYFGSTVRPMVIKLKEQAKPAKDATNVLEPLLKEYRTIKEAKYASDDARLIECYKFYSKNYIALRDNFTKLQKALWGLYSDPLVVSLMEDGGQVVDGVKYDGKGPHFRQFLGQLYIMQCCLRDGNGSDDLLSANWRPTNADPNFQKLRLNDVVEECQRMADSQKATPLTDYATVAVPRPVEPTPVSQPSAPPAEVFEPDMPAGKKPESLNVVTHPVRPTEADPGDPGAAPAEPVMSEILRTWAEEYKTVDYRARENAIRAEELSFTTDIVYSVSIDNKFRIRFLMPDGVTQIGETQLFQGGTSIDDIEYPEAPVRDQTAEWSYAFDRWERLTEGNEYIIDSDITFKAAYRWIKRTYPVEWKIDGEVVKTEYYEYGAIPSFTPAEKPSTEMYTYTFSGWNTFPLPVTEDAVYEGSYISTLRQYEITWILDGGDRVETQYLDASENIPTFMGVKDYVKNSELFFFRGWTPTCSSVLGNASYTAIYEPGYKVNGVDLSVEDGAVVATLHSDASSVLLEKLYEFVERTGYDLVLRRGNAGVSLSPESLAQVKASGCLRLALEVGASDRAGNAYMVRFYGANKKQLEIDTEVTVLYYYAAAAGVIPTCLWKDGNEWKSAETTRAGGVMRAPLRGAVEVLLATEYRVSYVPSTYCNTSSLISQAPAGTIIDVRNASYLYGYEAVGVTLTLADGSTRIIRGTSFEMPASVASIKIDVKKIIYTVSYVVDGKIVEVQEYYLGDTITPPENPTLEKNDGYVYSFIGWTPELTVAMGGNRDLICIAEFSMNRMATEEDFKALENRTLTNMVITIAIVAIGVVLLIVGTIVTIVVVRRRRRRNRS